VIYRPDAQLSKASSVRTTRTFRLDLPLCREASNYSSLDPSRRFSSTSGRHSEFDQLWDFLLKHSYGKIVATAQTTWTPIYTLSFIRQVSHSKSWRPDVSPFGPDARASDMEIACIRSTVRTTIPLVPNAWGLDMEITCSESATVQTWLKSGKNFSDRTVVRLDTLWLPSVRRLGFFKPNVHLNPQPINRGP
jgi:hypothetical protein